ncbi:WD40 repeat domain-containing protein [Actinoplanes missouriensis]|uniref:WD40 repeat domain-containing protein n=1 Tax=Actinoplanes missouriensis TaxID=1866 RepID=UPI0033CE3448
MPRQSFGSAATGWSAWAAARNALCRSEHPILALDVATAADGTVFAAFWSGGGIEMWDVTQGHRLGVVPADTQPTTRFTLGGDAEGGMWMAVHHQNGVTVLVDVRLGRVVASRAESETPALAFCRYPDGRFALATGFPSGLIRVLHDPMLDDRGAEILWHPGRAAALAGGMFPGTEGLLVSAGPGPEMVIWGLADGEPRHTLTVPATRFAPVLALGVGRAGELRLAESRGDVVRLWNAGTGSQVGGWDLTEEGPVRGIAFTGEPDAVCLAVNAHSDTLMIVDAHDGSDFGELRTEHASRARAVRGTIGDRPLLVTTAGGEVHVRDATAATLAYQPDQAVSAPHDMAFGFDRDGRRILMTAEFGFTILDADTGAVQGSGQSRPACLATSNEGHLLIVARTPSGVQLLDFTTQRAIGEAVSWDNESGRGWAAGEVWAAGVLAGGGCLLAVASPEAVDLWDLAQGKQAQRVDIRAHGTVESLALGAGSLMAAECGQAVKVFDLGSGGALVLEVPLPDFASGGFPSAVLALGTGPEGRPVLAVAERHESRIALWSVDTGEHFTTLETLGEVSSMAWGGSRFACSLAVGGGSGYLVLPWSRIAG